MTNRPINKIDDKSQMVITTPCSINFELPFCLFEVGLTHAEKEYTIQHSAKDGFYLIYTYSGKGVLKYGGKEEVLDKNYVVLINGNDTHEYFGTSSQEWVHYWIHFTGESTNLFSTSILNDNACGIYLEQGEAFVDCFKNLFQAAQTNDIKNSVYISMVIHHMLSIMVEDHFKEINGKKFVMHKDDIQNVINYIKENYSHQISLDDLIDIVHLSKYYFLKLFKQHTGLSPYEYLIYFRINKAKILLRSTDSSVGSVAEQVGFLDESNFIKQFKNITGHKPLVYRKQNW